jgi:hypothetical protein
MLKSCISLDHTGSGEFIVRSVMTLAGILAASFMNAEVIFSNYDPTDPSPFDESSFAIGQVGDPSQGPVSNFQWATPFSVLSTSRLESVKMVLAAAFPAGPATTVRLHGPDFALGNPVPGLILESWTIAALAVWNPNATAADLSVTLDSTVRPLLSPGQFYWVSASAPNDATPYSYSWYDYPDQQCCSIVSRRVDFAVGWEPVSSTAATLHITGTAVPEPAMTGVLAAIFIAGLGVIRLRS